MVEKPGKSAANVKRLMSVTDGITVSQCDSHKVLHNHPEIWQFPAKKVHDKRSSLLTGTAGAVKRCGQREEGIKV